MATTIGVKLDDETCARLKSLGAVKRRSAHWLMREAIREYLSKEEQAEVRNREADEAREAYQRTGEFITNEVMTAWFDTWGMSEALSPLTRRSEQ